MTMLEVKLLTSLKESSGATLASGAKVHPKGAAFSGTLDTLPKAIVDAIKGKEWYVRVTEVVEELIPEIAVEAKTSPNENPTLKSDDSEVDEGQSIGKGKKDDTGQSEDNLKDKIKKSSRKLNPKE